ncbi:hypothetical protein RU58_00027 [Achromobacter phage phiAxp-1]|uniref:DksA-like zinc-finger protein n=1 Tax=Achromobacter phage phiAxp-1 TaxID=1610509 RepID=UPI0006561607|nr:DksA-like zinc-finger protein [Achromobacter phage phiAxp-1]QDH84406.1 hypothetical protein Axy18_026 [Achromobacter phage vB_AxyS_19-32_Axy18]QDH84469.1 hypothetical protein Axy19_026 [Achromobacter phage vB_AxyS_19-32_Axy19]QDH84535.1 hypothetical protein Axy20_027 [Achromobacter phage vB_AxyS_19-32_Axy20]WNO48703.1 hypothetical protein [Achromobacter phage nyashin_LB6]AKJ71416.1 hypothetical protein RU58_00027 [Achromobacter phage phiAxp-1]
MADVTDMATDHIEIEDEKRIAHVREQLARQQRESSIEGECEMCGEERPRLVERQGQWACTFCRDRFKLG